MRIKQYIFLLSLFLTVLFTGCADDLIYKDKNTYPGNNSFYDGEGYDFSIFIDNGELRTRDVNFNEGASLRINSLWLGIFDIDTKQCVSNNEIIMDFSPITSGQTKTGLVRVDLDPPVFKKEDGTIDDDVSIEDKNYMMVCVANYQEVYIDDFTQSDSDLVGDNPLLLQNKLRNVKDWDDFNRIGVETLSAYSYPHNSDAPVLAGFLNDNDYVEKNPSETHVKINQFAKSDDIELSPVSLMDGLIFKFKKDSENEENGKINGHYYVGTKENEKGTINTQKTIFLRRLVANINVNINIENENLAITDVSYRRFNMPKAVYIIERKTTDIDTNSENNKGSFPNEKELSPNYADLNASNLYYTDDNWISAQNTTGFSFQHFANKHWSNLETDDINQLIIGDKDSNDYEVINREQLNKKGGFTALVGENGEPTDFNNYASYFVIKMHLIDKSTGRALEAEYTIHEGNTSDELGNPADDYEFNPDGSVNLEKIKGNPKDFSCARNMNYNYNVHILGVNYIYHNVTVGGAHYSGQGGKVWKIVYVNDPKDNDGNPYDREDDRYDDDTFNAEKCYYDGNTGYFINPVSSEGGSFENGIIIKASDKVPDISFRLYGYNIENGQIEGYNYNFPQQSFVWLNSIWPPSAAQYSHYFQDYEALINNKNSKDAIPDCLLKGLTIIDSDNDEEYDIIGFVQSLRNVKLTKDKKYTIKIEKSEINEHVSPILAKERNNYVRAIYITDRNGEPDPVDGCTTLVTLYSAAQYPEYMDQKYEMIEAKDENNGILSYEGNDQPYYVENGLEGTIDGIINHGGDGMATTVFADWAFRIIGYDDDDNFVDYCYNFDINDPAYDDFKDKWPATSYLTLKNNQSDLPTNLEKLLDGLRIAMKNGSGAALGSYTLTEFVTKYKENNLPNQYAAGFQVGKYVHDGIPEENIRHLYVFDKKIVEGNSIFQAGEKSFYYQIYGVSQYPYDDRIPVEFKVTPLGHQNLMVKWKEQYNSSLSNPDIEHRIHYVESSVKWCGTIDSYIKMPVILTDDDWIKEYKFDFYLNGDLKYTETYNREEWKNKKDLVDNSIVPIVTTLEWVPGEYDVKITPVQVDETKLYKGNDPVLLKGQLNVTPQSWNFSSSPWSNIDETNMGINYETVKGTDGKDKNFSKERNFFFEFNGLEMGVYSIKDNFLKTNNKDGIGDNFFMTAHDIAVGVKDGPTEGRFYQFKFKIIKAEKYVLYIDATCTGNEDNTRSMYVKVGNNETVKTVSGFPASIANTSNKHNPQSLEFEITQKDIIDNPDGVEIVVYNPTTGDTSGVNGTVRMYGISLEKKQ